MSLPSRTVTFGRTQQQHQNLYLQQQQYQQQLQQQQQQQQQQPQPPVVAAPAQPQLSLPSGPNIALPGPSNLSLPGSNVFRAPTPAQPTQLAPPKIVTNAVAGPSSPASPAGPAAAVTPVPLTLEQQHITAVEGIIPTLQNIVATVNLDCRLDLKTIALHARNAEYNPKVCIFII